MLPESRSEPTAQGVARAQDAPAHVNAAPGSQRRNALRLPAWLRVLHLPEAALRCRGWVSSASMQRSCCTSRRRGSTHAVAPQSAVHGAASPAGRICPYAIVAARADRAPGSIAAFWAGAVAPTLAMPPQGGRGSSGASRDAAQRPLERPKSSRQAAHPWSNPLSCHPGAAPCWCASPSARFWRDDGLR